VDDTAIERASAATTQLARSAGLSVDRVLVVHNSNKLALRLMPCDVFARVAVVGQEVASLEVELATRLASSDAPVACLDPRVEPRVYDSADFAVTFWTFYETATVGEVSAQEYANGLRRLHVLMQEIEVATPRFTDRLDEAQQLVANRDRTPRLADSDRDLLRSTLGSAGQAIHDRGAAEQLLHGEPHPGNLLCTEDGLRFIDLETCCRGPIEFDLAHTPEEVGSWYDTADQDLLRDCRRLVLAMVAAWRWDVHDQFPNGHRWGRELLTALRSGPPWPTLDELEGRLTQRFCP
jgi:aminoglycoside phosphotransferase (APT) family kinase protein